MGTEIERKFLVSGSFDKTDGEVYRQGYLCTEPERTVRVRLCGAKGFITVKGKNSGAVRAEFEYEIPQDDAALLLAMCKKPLIEKTRYKVTHEGSLWEIDVFHGENEGLIVAEIELQTEGQGFAKPNWLGQEVTDDARYYNSNLAVVPFGGWS